ncbi:MAG: ATP-dependent helicase, partial [Thermoleophilia bacterium]
MLTLAEAQQRAVRHGDGPLLLGAAGTGKTEAVARRLARLAGGEFSPDRVLVIAATQATARRLQARAEALLRTPYEELWIGTWPAICERLLRAHSTAAGLNPFFDVLGPAERLAMMLDHLDELPLRNHEIRGNPAGLLARLLTQIDALKAGSDPPEPDLAEFCAAHDRIVAASGNLDEGDVFLTLNKLFHERRDVLVEIATRFAHVMVDEHEDTTAAQRSILRQLATENPNHLYAVEAGDGEVPGADSLGGEVIELEEKFRRPKVRLWRCVNERAQAQAIAREVEHLLGEGTAPGAICVLIDDPAANGGPVSAAMEERGVPFHLAGPAALFQRPEVRDAIAWLRVLAAPDDSPAAARALTRPPIELRAADLARLTTIARRRKVDMVSACEAALESPQIPPEGRERIQAFLKLYGEASAALEERRADVFVRRLIERVGLRRQRLFAAEPEVAERLLGLSRLAELASAWARREAHGTTRDFVRYLSAVAEAGVEPAGGEEPPSPGAVLGLARRAAKGTEFDHVFLLGQGTEGAQACLSLVRSRVEQDGGTVEDSEEETQEEELFGPAEGLHATYRKLREEVLEASWRAGRELSEPRLDTVIDVNRAIARHLELLKLAALAQRPGEEATAEAIAAVNGLLRQVATPEQQTELDASPLDA